MGFDLGNVPYNPDGWGPPDTPAVPYLPRRDGASTAPHVPFAPFSRSDKLGRIADWTRNTNFLNPSARSGNSRDAVFDFALDDSAALAAAADNDSSFRLV
ncbi:eukaryotic translation initiation factor 3 subunit D-like, partial [Dendrobium catenatum]